MRRYPGILLAMTLLALAACGGKQPSPAGQSATTATDTYAAEKGIEVTDAEKAAYIEHMRAALSKDPNFSGPLPGSAEEAKAFADPPWLAD